LEIYAFVVMSNHIHLLLRSDKAKLSDTIPDFKAHTGREILKAIDLESKSRRDWMLNIFEFAAKKHKLKEDYQFWTHENHPELIYSDKFLFQKLNYIHENPARAGIVEKAEDYLYSSARDFAGLPCLLYIVQTYLLLIIHCSILQNTSVAKHSREISTKKNRSK